MKTISCFSLMFIVVLGMSSVLADVIPEGHHPVQREVSITNLSTFPEIVLIGYITGPMIATYEAYLIEENTPLQKGYKFNTLRVFAIRKAVLDAKGGLANIDFVRLAQTSPPVEMLDPSGDSVPDENPLMAEYYYYRISNVTDAAVTLSVFRQVLKYNNGEPDRTVEY